MQFNTTDTTLLLFILSKISATATHESKLKIEQFLLIQTKLNNNEYVKGKLLNFLFNELNQSNFELNEDQKTAFESLMKRIKFKATPR